MKVRDNYTVSLYIRLSSEDEIEGESNSVKNQRDLLTEFVSKHPELSGCRLVEHCDDGYSGVNFNRPGVNKMLEKVRKGEIHCIVVKDFSRFGRSYIEVGDYLEQVFPFLDVRFISVNDNYDSDNKSGTIGDIEVALRTLIYDLYSKDLSQKVKSGRLAKIKRGEFTSSYAPYGYKKSEENKHKLVIDEDAAKVVRYIFELAASGKKVTEIARVLNAEKIPSPNEYKALTNSGRNWAWASTTGTLWEGHSLSKFFRDERYIGSTVGGKTERITVGNPKVRFVDRDEWIVVPNTHEPIISKELFDKVGAMFLNIKQDKPKAYRIFHRKIRCHHCNRVMARVNKKGGSYECRTLLSADSPDCFDGNITEESIKDAVLSAIQTQAKLFNKAEKLKQKHLKALEGKTVDFRQSIRQLEADIVKLNIAKQEHYESYKDGKILKDDYLCKREAIIGQISEINSRIEALSANLSAFSEQSKGQQPLQNEWDNAINIKELNREIVDSLIESIIVFDSERIEIRWKFADGYLGM